MDHRPNVKAKMGKLLEYRENTLQKFFRQNIEHET